MMLYTHGEDDNHPWGWLLIGDVKWKSFGF